MSTTLPKVGGNAVAVATPASERPDPKCECTHHLSDHDREGNCNVAIPTKTTATGEGTLQLFTFCDCGSGK